MKKNDVKWRYYNEIFDTPRENYYGFIYMIEFESGDYYIGKRKFSSGWKSYKSSCNIIKERIKSGEFYRKNILCFVLTKQDSTYWELHYLISHNVLFNSNCLNDNILGKFYKGKINAKIL